MNVKVAFLVMLIGIVLSGQALAFSIEPTVSIISLPKDTGGVTLVVRNPRESALPLTFEIVERLVREDGSEETAPADDRFVVFPPQMVVPAGQTQAVRVQWVGGALDQSRSFTLYGAEQPFAMENPQQSGVKTLLRMGASVHVTAEQFSPQVKVSAFQAVTQGTSITLLNTGNEFVYIDDLTLQVGESKISSYDLANAAGRTLLPPGDKRTFIVPDVRGVPSLLGNPQP